MTREELIEAGAEALHGDNCPEDPDESVGEYCRCEYGHWEREAAVILDAVEPLIREEIAKEIENECKEAWHRPRYLQSDGTTLKPVCKICATAANIARTGGAK